MHDGNNEFWGVLSPGPEYLVTLPRWFLKFAFYLLYNQLAIVYDLVAWLVSFGQWPAWRRTVTLYMQAGPTLDLAHGTGGLSADLAELGWAVTGLDLSRAMSQLARGRLKRRGLPVRLVRGRAEHLPFAAGSFANVVVTFPADFILAPETLHCLVRVLKPGGRLLVVVMGQLKGPRLLRKLIDRAYQVTAQREVSNLDPLERLASAGFDASWQEATLNGATASLLVATFKSG